MAFQGKWEGLGLGEVWEDLDKPGGPRGFSGAQTLRYLGWVGGSQALERNGVWSAITGREDGETPGGDGRSFQSS